MNPEPIPDWLATVSRYAVSDLDGMLLPDAVPDGPWVRLADVVAATQPITKERQWADDFRAIALEQKARAESAEAEREALRAELEAIIALKPDLLALSEAHQAARTYAQELETKLAALQAERDRLQANFYKSVHQSFEAMRMLKVADAEHKALRAAVERTVAAFRAWDQTSDMALDMDSIDALHALSEAFDKLEGRRGLPNTPNQAGAEAAEPSGDEPPSTLPALMKAWRTGRKVGRTIYEQRGEEPFDGDELIGLMDSRELAAAAVEAHNKQLDLTALRAATTAYLEALKGPDDQALLNTRAAELVAAALRLLVGPPVRW